MRHLPILALCLLPWPAIADDAAAGAQVFRDHCATCHGLEARGDGPMTSILQIQPPDLTLLSASNGDVFPLERVVRQIDGRDEVLAHGGPMPVFGIILRGESGVIDADDGSPIFTPAPVVQVAEYLRSVQR